MAPVTVCPTAANANELAPMASSERIRDAHKKGFK